MKQDTKRVMFWVALGIISIAAIVLLFWVAGKFINGILPLTIGFIAGILYSKHQEKKHSIEPKEKDYA